MTNTHESPPLPAIPVEWAVKRGPGVLLPLGFAAFTLLTIPSIFSSPQQGAAIGTTAVFALLTFCGWALSRASKPPTASADLSNAVVMTDASTLPPDSWVHFARLSPIPWGTVLTFLILGVLMGGGCAGLVFIAVTKIAAGEIIADTPRLIGMGVILTMLGLLGLLFLVAAVRSFVNNARSSGWPARHGITLGETGIAYRLVDASIDIPWESIEAIEAVYVPPVRRKTPPQSTLEVVADGTRRVFPASQLGVSPRMLFTALRYYWQLPSARDELGTTVAQRRLDGWARTL